MGQAAPFVKALKCECLSDCARYVCNSMHLRSKCCGCLEFSMDTDEISLDSGSEEEIEVRGCFHWIKR